MENEITVSKAELITEVQKMLAQKAMFGTATCLDLDERFEIIYHFELEQGLKMRHIRVSLAKDDTLPSISNVYMCAALIENEMQEMFDIKISGIALDFKKGMLLAKESPKTPLMKGKE